MISQTARSWSGEEDNIQEDDGPGSPLVEAALPLVFFVKLLSLGCWSPLTLSDCRPSLCVSNPSPLPLQCSSEPRVPRSGMDFASVGDGMLGAGIISKPLSQLPDTGGLASPFTSGCWLEIVAQWLRT